MGRKKRRYTQDFVQEAVELVRTSSRATAAVAKDLGIPPGTLDSWVKSANAPPEATAGVSKDEEIARLRRENDRLRMERDFLKKAAAFFAKESK